MSAAVRSSPPIRQAINAQIDPARIGDLHRMPSPAGNQRGLLNRGGL